jgi:capsule polysaccharide export protein KpsE/RkpR
VGSLLRSVKGISFGLGGKAPRTETDLYTTIVYSRTMMEDIIRTFDMFSVYDLDSTDPKAMEKAVEWLQKDVHTEVTEEMAYVVGVRATTPQRSADMTNAIVKKMNARIVDLNLARSRQNREFLERRVKDIQHALRVSEDSLRVYQESTGLLDAKFQVQGILQAHTSLESELAARRIQKGILEEMYDSESPQVREMKLQISAYEKKLKEMRSRTDPGSPMVALNQLPAKGVELLRRYRDVEINSLILEYIMPLFEQAKIEESKDFPVLQIIDYAVPPATKSYPPRILFSFIGAFSVLILVVLFMQIRTALQRTKDPRIRSLLDGVKRGSWNWRNIKL